MEHPPLDLARLDLARRQFFEDGAEPDAELAPHIHRSWRRCSALRGVGGLSAARELAEPIDRIALGLRREASAWLLRCAQPELDGLAEHVLGQGCVVILSDASGLILDEIGSPEFLPKAHRIALAPGVEWSEHTRGTNAIGTALVERQALMVRGGEHYLDQNGMVGCVAAPILTPQGTLAGVLDISGESVRIDAHALGLVRMAAAQVEHRMLSAGNPRLMVRFHHRPGLLGTAREALLSVDDGVISGANRVALELLKSDWPRLIGAPIERIFGSRWARLQREPGLFPAPNGQQWAVVVDVRTRSWQGVRPAEAELPSMGAGAGAPDLAAAAEAARSAGPATPAASAAVFTPGLVSGWASSLAAGFSAKAPGAAGLPGTRGDPADAVDGLLMQAVRAIDEGLPVMVSGETGSGKAHFARRLHAASRRAAGPWVAVNCAAQPEVAIEAELFGSEEHAFSGARRHAAPGRLREADGGLLFLDEVGELPLGLQARLLRVLEERQLRPLGSLQARRVDFDLVCSSPQDLRVRVQQGQFREDLYYRLMGFHAVLPALRERADRRALIRQLLAELGGEKKGLQLSDAALQRLDAHPWPGNLRELSSVLRLMVALAEPGASLGVAQLPASLSGVGRWAGGGLASGGGSGGSSGVGGAHASGHGLGMSGAGSAAGGPPGATDAGLGLQRAWGDELVPQQPHAELELPLASLTEAAIQQALDRHGGRVAAAARSLGVHRSTLYRFLAKRGE